MDLARLRLLLPDLVPILDDPAVTDVMINDGGAHVWVDAGGVVTPRPTCHLDPRILRRVCQDLAREAGQDFSEASPILETRLDDGSRLAAVLPPIAVTGLTVTLRRFARWFTLAELTAGGTVRIADAARLTDAVHRRENLLIAGGTNTGKTVLLNALLGVVPAHERVAIIEETAEIPRTRPNTIRFETRPVDPYGTQAAISVREILRTTLRHRPDRIVLGEVRGAEAADLLAAWNTGHPGSFTTLHANSPADAVDRLASLARQGAPADDPRTHAIGLVVYMVRLATRRLVISLTEVDASQPSRGGGALSDRGVGGSC